MEIKDKSRVYFGYISPLDYLHKVPKDEPFHLILAHLLKYKKYVNFYNKRKEMGDYIILDNGAFEYGAPYSIENLLNVVKKSKINVDCIVAPDYPYRDGEYTINSAKKFIEELNARGLNYEVMAVPQSREEDYLDWIDCYERLSEIDGITHIGMSILGIPNAFKSITKTNDIMLNRIFATAYLLDRYLINKNVWHHYLGLGLPNELLIQRELGVIDSNDSSSPIWHGIQQIKYDNSYGGLINGKISKSVNFLFDKSKLSTDLKKEINDIINFNIERIKYITR